MAHVAVGESCPPPRIVGAHRDALVPMLINGRGLRAVSPSESSSDSSELLSSSTSSACGLTRVPFGNKAGLSLLPRSIQHRGAGWGARGTGRAAPGLLNTQKDFGAARRGVRGAGGKLYPGLAQSTQRSFGTRKTLRLKSCSWRGSRGDLLRQGWGPCMERLRDLGFLGLLKQRLGVVQW